MMPELIVAAKAVGTGYTTLMWISQMFRIARDETPQRASAGGVTIVVLTLGFASVLAGVWL